MARGERNIEIIADSLRVNYGDFCALSIDNLRLTGRTICIVGENGSGKSTFLKTLLEVLVPRQGSLTARFIREGEALKPELHMAFSPENGAVFADVTVESYLTLWCRIRHSDGAYYRKEKNRYVERLGVDTLLSKRGVELSKGQRRRVQIAVGYLLNPELFLFDEPFDGLDLAQSHHLTQVMLEEASRRAMIISSHRTEIIERIADAVIVLAGGKPVAAGPVHRVIHTLCPEVVKVGGASDRDSLRDFGRHHGIVTSWSSDEIRIAGAAGLRTQVEKIYEERTDAD